MVGLVIWHDASGMALTPARYLPFDQLNTLYLVAY